MEQSPPNNFSRQCNASPARYRFWLLATLLFIAVAVRSGVLLTSPTSFADDPDAYRLLAQNWEVSGTFGQLKDGIAKPTAFRPPLYPAILKWIVDPSTLQLNAKWLAVLHIGLGVGTVVATFLCFQLLAKSTFPNWSDRTIAWGGFLSGILVACDPILLRQSQLIMTETLAAFLTAISLLMFAFAATCQRDYPFRLQFVYCVLLGLVLGLNCLCRPSAILWVLSLGGIALLAAFWQSPILSRLANLSGVALGIVTILLPWGLRNAQELGAFRVATTHGGYTLLLANNDSLYDHFQSTWSRDWDERTFFSEWSEKTQSIDNELIADKLANDWAWKTIQSRPIEFIRSCAVRFVWLWIPWPNQPSLQARIAIGSWYVTSYCFAFAAILLLARYLRKRSRLWGVWLPSLTLIISISTIHSVYWSNMRMRAVCIPVLAMLASIGLLVLFQFLQNRLNRPTNTC